MHFCFFGSTTGAAVAVAALVAKRSNDQTFEYFFTDICLLLHFVISIVTDLWPSVQISECLPHYLEIDSRIELKFENCSRYPERNFSRSIAIDRHVGCRNQIA